MARGELPAHEIAPHELEVGVAEESHRASPAPSGAQRPRRAAERGAGRPGRGRPTEQAGEEEAQRQPRQRTGPSARAPPAKGKATAQSAAGRSGTDGSNRAAPSPSAKQKRDRREMSAVWLSEQRGCVVLVPALASSSLVTSCSNCVTAKRYNSPVTNVSRGWQNSQPNKG